MRKFPRGDARGISGQVQCNGQGMGGVSGPWQKDVSREGRDQRFGAGFLELEAHAELNPAGRTHSRDIAEA